jgi:HAE1 family hydrophobic/amphiphilic exporter-1
MSLADISVRRPVATTMMTLIVVVIGLFALIRLPIDLLPDVSLPTLSVRGEYGNASPEEMERLVTERIEATVSLVSGVEEISSESGEGVSNVTIRFVWGTDLDTAANDVRDRLDRVTDELPEDMPRPQLRKFDISASPIVLLGVSSALAPVEMTRLLEDQILYRFERLEGVAAVDLWGEFTREIRVELDLGKIKALNLALDEILDAIRAANVDLPAGTLERGRYEVSIRTPGEFESLSQLESLVVAMRERGPIRLGEIATILDTHRDLTRIIRIDGKQGVRLAVRKQSDANTADVAARVLAEVRRLNAEMPQVTVTPVINQGEYIERAIANVGRSVLYGGGLAVLVLLIFLRNVRSTLVIGVAIPISVIATFALILFGGFTLNLMTLGGLALGVGMMVDNSIVVLENIFRRRNEEGDDPSRAAVRGAGEVASAIFASTITTLIIFLPLAFVRGVSGVLFQELALVVAFSLIVSLVVALTVVPMLASKLIRARSTDRGGPIRRMSDWAGGIFTGLERVYEGLLRDALRARLLTAGLALLLLLISLPLIDRIGTEFLPPSDEGEVRVTGEMEVGTRLDLVDRQTKLMESMVFPAVSEAVSAVVSIGASSWNPGDAAEGDIRMALKPAAQRSRSNTQIADDLRRRLIGQVPGMEIRTRAPQGQRLIERIVGGDEGLQIEVRGYDLATLDALVAEGQRVIADIPGITDITVSREAGVPQELVQIDRERAADLGVSVRRIAQTLETALGGTRAGDFRDGGNEYRILVRLRDAKRIPLEEILDITVRGDRGEDVALRNVVTVQSGHGPLVIDRKDQQRIATLSANISGRDLGAVAADAHERLMTIPRPVGYDYNIAGAYEEQQRAFRELLLTFAMAIVLVYMVLASQYESLRDPFVVMLSVPTAAIGVLAVLFLTSTTLNVQSYIGCIMLGGIVVNNAILLVDQAGRLRAEGRTTDQAVLEAGRRRLRPILMTTLTTILGLLPLALGIGEGAEAQAPLARAVVGGLTFSTLVTLVLVPAVYSLVHSDRRKAPL